jgi:hypothetical protein
VTINGDINLVGQINAINMSYSNIQVNTTVLNVQDKDIKLAFNDDITTVDGIGNEAAGVIVTGTPSNYVGDYVTPSSIYNKSILWHNSTQGTNSLGSSNPQLESFWEVEGGGLRITRNKLSGGSNVSQVSFTFRLNENDELCLTKTYLDPTDVTSNNHLYTNCAKFGRVL